MPIVPSFLERLLFFKLNLGPGPAAKAVIRILGLNFLHLLGGQVYAFDQIAGWLATAGFTNPRRISLFKSPISLVLGTKAA